jgi:hypothetical protein
MMDHFFFLQPWTEVFALGMKMRTFFEQNLKNYAGWLVESTAHDEDNSNINEQPPPKRSRLQ